MVPVIPRIVVVGFLAFSQCGCGERKPAVTNPVADAKLSALPVELTVRQRTTTSLPGSDGKLLLTIDDITRNQVMVSLATSSKKSVLPTRSMSPDDAIEFLFGEASYLLTLKQLDNELVGEDVATFVVLLPTETGLTEEAKIARLIAAVADLQDAKFVRNGTEYSAADAAEHLQKKWDAAREEIKTAEQFIDSVASKSSVSGEPYQIRLADGKVLQAGEYLRDRLDRIENAH